MNLPYRGEIRLSPNKKFKETVVFVHHFGGNKRSTKRHQNMVLEMGFDCVTFNLFESSREKRITRMDRIKRLIFHLVTFQNTYVTKWMKELNGVLNAVEGEKILFSLSSPSTSVVGCLGKLKRKDIKAWICDGGPFVEIWQCFKNYAAFETRSNNSILANVHTSFGFILFGGVGYVRRLKQWLKNFPPNFPILNFRAHNDQLVPLSAIEGFFALDPKLKPKTVLLPHSGHLEGIKLDKELYQSQVESFLRRHATPI